ncbi:MAG: efflux RND transporter permease subunit [bacterium]|nr:MAG: efflux RND transporter permease subunit [bacterium]
MLDYMMRKSLTNRSVVLIGAVILLAAGIVVALRMPIDVFPDLTAPTVTVMTEAHGMAPEEVEMLVSFPIEAAVNGASGVRRVRSTSIQGFSTVHVEFDWGMDIYKARQIVNEKLQGVWASLPEEVDQPMLAPVTSLMGEIMAVGLTSSKTSLMDLRTLADFTIRKRLLAVPGVASVKVYGGEVKQYQVLIDPHLLRKYEIGLSEVLNAAGGSNVNASGGFFIHSGQEYLIRGLGRIRDIEELKKTVVATRSDVPVLLQDVARITTGAATKLGEAAINMEKGVLLVITKQPGANTLELTRQLDSVLDEIDKAMPADVQLHTEIFKQSDFIQRAVNNVIHALRDGAILVVIILFVFLANIRTTLISVLAIPLSLVFAILILRLLGLSVNTMTLGGMAIAIGVLVDDAIIYVENVLRRVRQNVDTDLKTRKPFFDVVIAASSEIRAPIANATFIIIVVFIPLFFLSGIEGRMLKPLGIAYAVSVFASLLVAVVVSPALCGHLLWRIDLKRERESFVVRKLKALYSPVLEWSTRHGKPIMIGAAVLVILTVTMLANLGRSFLPEFNEGTLNISIATVPGTSLEESDRIGDMAERLLLDHSSVVSVARRTGRTKHDEHSLGSHAHEVEVTLADDIDKEKVLEDIRERLGLLPGTIFIIGQPISHRIDHMLSGTRANIAVKVFGPDLARLRSISADIKEVMEEVEGVTDLSVDQQVDIPQVRIRANREKMALYGLTMMELDELIDVAFLGAVVSEVYDGQNRHELVVRYDEEFRGDLESIKESLIDTPSGAVVPLDMVADIRIDRGPNYISRENVQRKIVVQANVKGRDMSGVVEDIREGVTANVDLPEGYFVQYGGQFESAESASRIISLLSLLSLVLIVVALNLEFGNLRDTLLVLVNLPLALIGGVLAVVITGGVLNIASMVGFITLFGISVRNGIMMVSHYNHLMSVEGLGRREAVQKGSLERLSPILMTALTTGLALLPMALASGKPGNEIQAPMSIVILGGLLTATLLNMIVIPVLFHRYGKGDVRA